jgi:hypothetical protein
LFSEFEFEVRVVEQNIGPLILVAPITHYTPAIKHHVKELCGLLWENGYSVI